MEMSLSIERDGFDEESEESEESEDSPGSLAGTNAEVP